MFISLMYDVYSFKVSKSPGVKVSFNVSFENIMNCEQTVDTCSGNKWTFEPLKLRK